MQVKANNKRILVTGATGYVGGRLVRLLLKNGYRVRAAVRSKEKAYARFGTADHTLEVFQADLLDLDHLIQAAQGCQVAFYLVHSLIRGHDFAEIDRRAAINMTKAAQFAKLERIIYLGGIGGAAASQSAHLASRHEVGRILKEGRVPVTILRAAIILGSGSASFEIIRYVVDRTPVIPAPVIARNRCQPICIRNVLLYLLGCLEKEETTGQTFDIGGPDILSYAELLRIYNRQAGLQKRTIWFLPRISLKLVTYFISLISPVPAPIVRGLLEGLRDEVVCRENRIRNIVPQNLMTCEEAIQRALEKIEQQIVDTYYYDAGSTIQPEWADSGDHPYSGGSILGCTYRIGIHAPPERVWKPIQHIGGDTGWYFGGRLWWLRGFLDKLVGGVGVNRGRRHPSRIAIGDILDCWRVLDVKQHRRILLLAEMKLPGEALLEFRLERLSTTQTRLTMNAKFLARGLAGLAYWYGIYPLHDYVFKGMLANIAKACGAKVSLGPEKVIPVQSNFS
jgi:uncharacterized protein YbjT (DUF2867 family)